jgi:hypothetical protein
MTKDKQDMLKEFFTSMVDKSDSMLIITTTDTDDGKNMVVATSFAGKPGDLFDAMLQVFQDHDFRHQIISDLFESSIGSDMKTFKS